MPPSGRSPRSTADRLVLVDGVYRADLSKWRPMRPVIELMSLAAMLAKAPAGSRPSSRIDSGVGRSSQPRLHDRRRDAQGAQGPGRRQPVLLVHARAAAEAGAIAVRNVISVEAGAKLTLIEAHVALDGAAAANLTNAVTDVTVADGAACRPHQELRRRRRLDASRQSCDTRIGKDANYRGFQLSGSPALARNDINITFAGEGGKLDLSGVFLARGSQHVDTTLVVDHAVPACESRELFKAFSTGARTAFSRARSSFAPTRRRPTPRDGATAAAVAGRAVLPQAGARDLRRRCRMRPWRDVCRDRRRSVSTCARAASRKTTRGRC